jgi:predicted secreted hydrolase
LILALIVAGAVWLGRSDSEIAGTITVAEAMTGDTTGYARATGPRTFSFPEDHGPHPEYKTEWWYYTGNLSSPEKRHFGYQFTIFRIALTPEQPDAGRTSEWATNQLYMAHFTLTDVTSNRFQSFERFSRGAAGLAGAETTPHRVWLEDWTISQDEGDSASFRIRVGQDDIAVDLLLEPAKPVVLQGQNGYDRKGPRPGDASYYYSIPRLATSGSVRTPQGVFDVEGLSWMDREWSTSALETNQVGWDWFSLHLSDGRDLMYYQIRERGGTVSSFSDGVLIDRDGTVTPLLASDVEIEVTDHWKSPRTGAEYPAGWVVRVPSERLELEIVPYVLDQELETTIRYWEGAVRFTGKTGDKPLDGSGYVEMTGYGFNPGQRM